ncbi:MAG: hypothetical protein ACYDA8_07595 [Deferrisomatales bacterium]
MGIVRLIVYAALGWLLYRLVRGLLPGAGTPSPRRPPAPGGRIEGGELVQDPHCGVYVPRQGAVAGPDGTFFCSPECRDAHQARRG